MREQNKKHPLVQQILELVEFDPKYENMGFPEIKALYLIDESKHKIQQEFEKYFESDELIDLITTLLQLAAAFDREGHKGISLSILEIVVTANESLEKRKIPT